MHAHGSSKQRPSAALTQRLGQLRMLPRLPAALKASLKLALQRKASSHGLAGISSLAAAHCGFARDCECVNMPTQAAASLRLSNPSLSLA